LGREEEFFRACSVLVDRLSWEEVVRLGGASLTFHAKLARQAQDGLSDPAPRHLAPGRIEIVPNGPAHFVVQTYSSNDPIQLRADVVGALVAFDGRETDEVLAELREKRGIELSPELLRLLVDYEVLEAIDEQA
jgi:hypothetical protein